MTTQHPTPNPRVTEWRSPELKETNLGRVWGHYGPQGHPHRLSLAPSSMEPVLYPRDILLVRKYVQVLKVVWGRWSAGTLTQKTPSAISGFSAIRSLAEGCFGGHRFEMAAELMAGHWQ